MRNVGLRCEKNVLRRIIGPESENGNEDFRLLGYNAVQSVGSQPTFPYSGSRHVLHKAKFIPEDIMTLFITTAVSRGKWGGGGQPLF
jgi:hypothetical protein